MRFRRAFEALPGYPLAGIPETRRQLESEGVDVIDLGAGDADLAPPPAAVARLRQVASDPRFGRYGFQMGLAEYRTAISQWMSGRFGVDFDPVDELLPLIGSKEGIAHLPLAFLDPGDVGIIPDPGYQAYQGGVVLAGGEPYKVPLRPEHGFLVPLEQLPADVVARARILYLNYPNNPTSACAEIAYFEEAVAFCKAHDILLVHDHAYSEIAFDGYRPPSIFEVPEAREVALEFHSLSKTYNMTGWRLGWVAGAAPLVAALRRVKTFMDTGSFLAVQAAGAAALGSYEEWVPGNVAVFQHRRDRVVESLRSAGFAVQPPRATMYVWVPVPEGHSDESFCRRALEEQGVIVLPGSALGEGGRGFFRIALTVEEGRLSEATERLADLL